MSGIASLQGWICLKNARTAGLGFALCLLLAVVIGCSSPHVAFPDTNTSAGTERPLLNSERIHQEFGSYGIEVLEDGNDVRVSNLYSIMDGSKVTRTIAVVNYPSWIPNQLLPAHREIRNGGSIGEVFARGGWSIAKRNLYFGEWQVSTELSGVYARMGGIAPNPLAVHVYEFVVSREGEQFQYATITEIHHPDYLDESELKSIYGPGVGNNVGKYEIASNLETAKAAVLKAVPPLKKAASRQNSRSREACAVRFTRLLWV